MKKVTILLTVFLLIILTASAALMGQGKSKNLKPQKERQNMEQAFSFLMVKILITGCFTLKIHLLIQQTVFTVQNGVIHIKGDPFGYMRTKETYSDYTLHVEWRYPTEATNSGIFIHAQMPDTIWLKCIECQLKAGNAGDFVCMNGAEMNEQKDKTKRVVKKMTALMRNLSVNGTLWKSVCNGKYNRSFCERNTSE